jgi:hypothetical protein
MKRRHLTAALGAAALPGRLRAAAGESDAASGVRTALERGALAAVAQLGRVDGFLGNPQLRIPLPGHLKDAARLLVAVGQRRQVDELVTAMNRAAEAAVPAARTLFVGAVRSMSIEDALHIVRGGPTSATDFFVAKTRAPLTAQFLPIVTRATEGVDLARRYNAVAAKAGALGLVRGDESSVQTYVTARALDALFRLIGDEEQRIRADPIATGSAILRKVFGG